MSVLDQHIHEDCFSMMQVSGHTNISDTLRLLSHQIKQILSLIVSLQRLVMVIAFLMFGRHQRCFQTLPIFLFYHDFCPRIHFFMRNVKLLILMQHNLMFIRYIKYLLNTFRNSLLLFYFVRLRFRLYLWADIVTKLVVKILLVHMIETIYYKK